MTTKPSPAAGTATFDSSSLGDDFVAVNRACEVVAVVVSAGGGSVAVRFYDSTSSKLLIAANAGESTPFCPSQPMKFERSVRLVFEQGGQTQGGGEVSLLIN